MREGVSAAKGGENVSLQKHVSLAYFLLGGAMLVLRAFG